MIHCLNAYLPTPVTCPSQHMTLPTCRCGRADNDHRERRDNAATACNNVPPSRAAVAYMLLNNGIPPPATPPHTAHPTPHSTDQLKERALLLRCAAPALRALLPRHPPGSPQSLRRIEPGSNLGSASGRIKSDQILDQSGRSSAEPLQQGTSADINGSDSADLRDRQHGW